MSKSAIEWTEQTWNPIAGCTWASAGCDHCYAAGMTRRLEAMGQADYAGLTTAKHFNGQIRTLPAKLAIPLQRRKPTMWFVNSMSDLFHKGVDGQDICDVFGAMALCPQHTFQVLTKRPERMAEFCNRVNIRDLLYDGMERVAEAAGIADFLYEDQWPLRNVWLGTSVENQEQADKRIPHLLQVPAAVRFLSCEPLLGAIELSDVTRRADAAQVWGKPALQGINWIIVGGESGPGARPMHPDWARSLRDQCTAAGVPFFFKQWGEFEPAENYWSCQADGDAVLSQLNTLKQNKQLKWWPVTGGKITSYPWCQGTNEELWKYRHSVMVRSGKKTAGRLLDGREWNEMPEVTRG